MGAKTFQIFPSNREITSVPGRAASLQNWAPLALRLQEPFGLRFPQGTRPLASGRNCHPPASVRRFENPRHDREHMQCDVATRAMGSAVDDRARHVGQAQATIVGEFRLCLRPVFDPEGLLVSMKRPPFFVLPRRSEDRRQTNWGRAAEATLFRRAVRLAELRVSKHPSSP